MIYTSYYKNPILKEDNTISISLYPPKWFNVKEHILELSPSKKILLGIKNGTITQEEYISDFKEQLSKLNVDEYYNRIKDRVLLCYEKPGDFCHRHLVREWFKNNGYRAIELLNYKKLSIAIIGSYTFKNKELVKKVLNLFNRYYKFNIISGGTRGANKLGRECTIDLKIPIQIFPANWNKYSERLGVIKNIDIIENSDIIIAFLDMKSVGIKHSIDLATKLNKILIIYDINKNKFII